MSRIALAGLLFALCCGTPARAAPALELVTLQYPPYQYQENGEVKGFAADLVREAFRRLNLAVHISVYPWGRSIAMVTDGRADAIFTLYRTPEREALLDYSNETLAQQEVSLFVRKDSPISSGGRLDALSAYRFGVVRAVSYGVVFDQAVKSGQIKVGEVAASGEQNMDMLLAQRFDILVSNRLGARDILRRRHEEALVRELSPPLEAIPSYMAFARKRSLAGLRQRFDAALAAMKRDGSYARLSAAP
ncbi:transporter substrate-binding domain-containing protein [Chromobacterium subtsugae]|uniref:Transporter substrate-binding domain-containing protein n=1 Tax=Chromobacterium subtsugae TaxID=251747 RepID=A0ABS7FD29_9NEIS|nr:MULTISPECIES: transporter substrate-binding domain-containing protein [Chromobacterium]MBW7565657.1 amino acid ABC transporter substrate-binding protein [Chromobacterium subtsugae]MBW8287988.1 transporter substrate-binding domain-containing protein [Chromobacterium subtsugae]OBU86875.1 amino acid ABC transporter substrate-binding protein [Chromobacterium subtsugae]WSE89755.1 transporter substrate-binding domain-containing protein [Chromobacterium subtsugae]WVH58126.1 transporter substrate-b